VFAAESNPEIRRDGLRMRFLALSDRTTILGRLDEFVADYERWIAAQSVSLSPSSAASHRHRQEKSRDLYASGAAYAEWDTNTRNQ
jgi:hypothetical protein